MKKFDFENKTKTTAIVTTFVIGILLLLPIAVAPNVEAIQPNPSLRVPANIQQAQAPPAGPALSAADKKDIAEAVLNVPGVKNWSNQWKLAGIGYLGTRSGSTVTWNDAIVVLRLPSNVPAPVSCNIGWSVWAKVDLNTKQVVNASYPTLASHQCDTNVLAKAKSKDPPGFSIGTQNDVNGTNWYGNYAVIETPSYSSTIFSAISPDLIAQTDNALWNTPSQCSGACFTQGGWEITDQACSGCGISANTADVVYVDQSSTGTMQGYNTGLSWSSGTTEAVQINCPSGSSYYQINIAYGSNPVFQWTTNVPCGTGQLQSDTLDNSVFFENQYTGSSSNWSGDVTSSVLGTTAEEYDSTNTAYYWSTSNNVDEPCTGANNIYASTVMTGSLSADQNAYWTYLSNVPNAC